MYSREKSLNSLDGCNTYDFRWPWARLKADHTMSVSSYLLLTEQIYLVAFFQFRFQKRFFSFFLSTISLPQEERWNVCLCLRGAVCGHPEGKTNDLFKR